MRIRETSASDRAEIQQIHTLASGRTEEADLTSALLIDPSPAPMLSLIGADFACQIAIPASIWFLFSGMRDAWMVPALRPDVLGATSSRVRYADVLYEPEYLRE